MYQEDFARRSLAAAAFVYMIYRLASHVEWLLGLGILLRARVR